jgi:hypothetical protein
MVFAEIFEVRKRKTPSFSLPALLSVMFAGSYYNSSTELAEYESRDRQSRICARIKESGCASSFASAGDCAKAAGT